MALPYYRGSRQKYIGGFYHSILASGGLGGCSRTTRLLAVRVPMNAVAWASADHHKDKLPSFLLAQLKERANADNDGLVPKSLKMFLSEHDQLSPICAIDPGLIVPSCSATWLETVLRQSVLSEADINQLYTYRDQLTLNSHPPWLDGSEQAMEAVHDVEDILGDLFPDALL